MISEKNDIGEVEKYLCACVCVCKKHAAIITFLFCS